MLLKGPHCHLPIGVKWLQFFQFGSNKDIKLATYLLILPKNWLILFFQRKARPTLFFTATLPVWNSLKSNTSSCHGKANTDPNINITLFRALLHASSYASGFALEGRCVKTVKTMSLHYFSGSAACYIISNSGDVVLTWVSQG